MEINIYKKAWDSLHEQNMSKKTTKKQIKKNLKIMEILTSLQLKHNVLIMSDEFSTAENIISDIAYISNAKFEIINTVDVEKLRISMSNNSIALINLNELNLRDCFSLLTEVEQEKTHPNFRIAFAHNGIGLAYYREIITGCVIHYSRKQ